MFSSSKSGRGITKLTTAVEALEGRTLLSRFFFDHRLGIEVNNTADVRHDQPLFGSGVAVKLHPRFYEGYQGPQRPELNGTAASAKVVGKNIVLTGTVAGPIVAKPTTAAQGAVYTFGFDTGGASKTGPFPGRPHIRFDAVVVVTIQPKVGVSGFTQSINSVTNAPTTAAALKSSAIAIHGDTLTVTIPTSSFPSSGKAIDQWTVEFISRNPTAHPSIHDLASLVPEFTNFQLFYPPPK